MTATQKNPPPIEVFIAWFKRHVRGDEKGEAQIFLDRLFQAFGWEGVHDAGATCEARLRNTDGGVSFLDLAWKPFVLIEMKKRGTNLSQHLAQMFEYWVCMVPNRPAYAILCNFDEFWIYDFETQIDTPVEVFKTLSLSENISPLSFLSKDFKKPIFGNHQETVTKEVATALATLFKEMRSRGVAFDNCQKFILQTIIALFSQDTATSD